MQVTNEKDCAEHKEDGKQSTWFKTSSYSFRFKVLELVEKKNPQIFGTKQNLSNKNKVAAETIATSNQISPHVINE